ncbi:F5/8 type C domain-containing protein [Sinomicrobium oceani]|uniref:F5/8 type C domain-containing protein n=1 Tax=Sinomicrobium oceani TaxID=1150368 RepID=A0A1K1MY81_9FLAO|nr:discoidin domain-containing protein [Sinomicrobium oceani]SFW27993.1 F5/8 type C domain-containing protein [Sinomicrobium oceani]
MNTFFKSIMACGIATALYSCNPDYLGADNGPGNDNDPGNQTANEWSSQPYKLNVVYFLPQNTTAFTDFEERLSGILLQTQEFFAENLDREGFGRKSFGMELISQDMISIDIVEGQYEADHYPYSGGGSNIIPELEQYFATHQNRKKSEHTLVILPSTSGDSLNPGGVPFYGLGKYCFALDYPAMDIQYLGQSDVHGNLATKWIGGLIHELGHGLNASHNKERKSEQATLGTALMGGGNHTYGKTPTFITGASAATFANSQTFSTTSRTDWYQPVNHKIIKLRGKTENGNIIIDAKFESDLDVNDINIWHDPYPAGGNKDYDAPAWTVKPIGTDSLHIACPLTDFYTLEGEYQLRIRFYHENGTAKTYSYEYEFENGTPNIGIINTKELINRDGWSVIDADSEEDTGAASKMLDGDQSSVWHTEWKNSLPAHPHYFVLDMGSVTSVKGFAFANRSNLNGAIKDFELFGSNDNSTWQSLGNYTLQQVMNWQYIDLSSTQSYRYIKLVTANSYGNFNYTHLAELGAYVE